MTDPARTCTHPSCQHGGEPQPLESFPVRIDTGKPGSWCHDCWLIHWRKTSKKRRSKIKGRNKIVVTSL